MRKKVVIAFSGGIDSLAVSLILKERADYEISAVFMRLDNHSQAREEKAKAISERLDLDLTVIDLREAFQQHVIDYFLRGYREGKTPNPCVVCNKEIKFGLLLKKVRNTLGGDFLATGHYARLLKEDEGGAIKLLRARDREKDQSYFLWQLEQEQLSHILFPLGHYLKEDVKTIVEEAGFKLEEMPESQELCFIKRDYRSFLKGHIRTQSGDIINDKGELVGQHQGLYAYTLGQRRKFDLSKQFKGPKTKPYYVLDKDLKANRLIVTQDRNKLFKKKTLIKNLNWIAGQEPDLPLSVMAKIRSQSSLSPATLNHFQKGICQVVFKKEQLSFSPGQSLVFYDEAGVLLGGGIIS